MFSFALPEQELEMERKLLTHQRVQGLLLLPQYMYETEAAAFYLTCLKILEANRREKYN